MITADRILIVLGAVIIVLMTYPLFGFTGNPEQLIAGDCRIIYGAAGPKAEFQCRELLLQEHGLAAPSW
ncbi:MAG: hypothetical protein JO001_01805 [Alphaproteobacteria bacterium]|nr:hypothetical protein [Alphaproteobacteria bacterium]